MSGTCWVNVMNNSGRSLDAIALWHTPDAPSDQDVKQKNAIIAETNVADGKTLGGSVNLPDSLRDMWTCAVQFSGDGQQYFFTGDTLNPYKEYEVSDDTIISFSLPQYTTGTNNQSDVGISYSEGDTDTSFFFGAETLLYTDLVIALTSVLTDLIKDAAPSPSA